jgi:hypothetical protein
VLTHALERPAEEPQGVVVAGRVAALALGDDGLFEPLPRVPVIFRRMKERSV